MEPVFKVGDLSLHSGGQVQREGLFLRIPHAFTPKGSAILLDAFRMKKTAVFHCIFRE